MSEAITEDGLGMTGLSVPQKRFNQISERFAGSQVCPMMRMAEVLSQHRWASQQKIRRDGWTGAQIRENGNRKPMRCAYRPGKSNR